MGIPALPPRIPELLEAQFGVVARSQLLEHVTASVVDGHVYRGGLVAVERAVYRARGAPPSPEQKAMAAVLRCSPGAVLTGPLVLALLNVDGFGRSLPFEVLVPPGRRHGNLGFAWRRNPTPDALTARIGALPVAVPTVALVDAARWVGKIPPRTLRVGFDAARWAGLTTTDKVRERCDVLGPRDPGAAFFLELLGGRTTAAPESEPERRLGAILADFDPAPEPQVWVRPGRRVDWYWRRLRLAFEYQGRADHGHPEARAADGMREQELADRGIAVVSVVAEDLASPDDLRAWIRVLGVRRADELGVPAPVLR